MTSMYWMAFSEKFSLSTGQNLLETYHGLHVNTAYNIRYCFTYTSVTKASSKIHSWLFWLVKLCSSLVKMALNYSGKKFTSNKSSWNLNLYSWITWKGAKWSAAFCSKIWPRRKRWKMKTYKAWGGVLIFCFLLDSDVFSSKCRINIWTFKNTTRFWNHVYQLVIMKMVSNSVKHF